MSWVLPRGDIFFLAWRHDYTSYFRGIRDGGEFFYEDLGWEQVDSVPCLEARLDSVPGKAAPRLFQIVWFDFTRGGHAVRIQAYTRDLETAEYRITKFAKLPASGTEIWIPTTVVSEAFAPPDARGVSIPRSRRETRVVGSSIRIDEVLPDSYFVPHDKGTKADPNALRLREMHRNDPPEPTAFVKTDPASVERRLDENLREALEQQTELKASAPATDLFYRNLLIQAALVVVSLAALGYAARLVIRGRRGS